MPWIEKEGRSVEEARAAAIAAARLPESELEVEVLREGAKGLFGLGGEPALVRVRPRSEAVDVRSAFRDDRPRPAPAPEQPPAPEEPEPAAPERPPPPEEAEPPAPAPAREAVAEPSPDRAEPAAAEPRVQETEDEDQLSLAERQEQAMEVGGEMVRGVLQRMGLDGEVTTRASGGTVYVEIFGDDMGILIGRGGATLEALQELVRAGVQRKLRTRQAVVVDVEAYWERRRGRRRGPGGRDRQDRENDDRS